MWNLVNKLEFNIDKSLVESHNFGEPIYITSVDGYIDSYKIDLTLKMTDSTIINFHWNGSIDPTDSKSDIIETQLSNDMGDELYIELSFKEYMNMLTEGMDPIIALVKLVTNKLDALNK